MGMSGNLEDLGGTGVDVHLSDGALDLGLSLDGKSDVSAAAAVAVHEDGVVGVEAVHVLHRRRQHRVVLTHELTPYNTPLEPSRKVPLRGRIKCSQVANLD